MQPLSASDRLTEVSVRFPFSPADLVRHLGNSATTCEALFVGHSCGTLLRDTLVEHPCGTLAGHACRTLLSDTLVGLSCGTLLSDTLGSHSRRALFRRGTLAGHSCRTLLRDSLEGQAGRPIRASSPAEQFCNSSPSRSHANPNVTKICTPTPAPPTRTKYCACHEK